MSSRSIIAGMQRTNSYIPNNAIANHVKRETIELDSQEQVVELENGMYAVASEKFQGRYYIVKDGVCSASDSKATEKCLEAVKAFQAAQKQTEKATQDLAITQMIQMGIHRISDTVFSVPSQTEEPNHIVVCGGFLSTPEYCSCKWFKNGGWSKHLCKHAEAVHLFIQEEVQTVDQKVYDDLVASGDPFLAVA